jgi:hypothetical protein
MCVFVCLCVTEREILTVCLTYEGKLNRNLQQSKVVCKMGLGSELIVLFLPKYDWEVIKSVCRAPVDLGCKTLPIFSI